ncbi:MAG TPA: thioredoxin family protein [Longimicrobiaceae bacterium]|jgi:thiol:disulfide interchange protein|nr:thioredoxin family protein [Longimicrobiaceae bacterium]
MNTTPRRALLALAAAVALTCASQAHAQRLYNPRANARAEIDSAMVAARADHKLVLIDFGADWCLDCVILDRLFQDADVAAYLDAHYHVVRVDVGQFDHNLDLVKKFGSPIEGGVPAVVVVAPTGRMVATTRDGALESARRMNPAQVLAMLRRWAAPAA